MPSAVSDCPTCGKPGRAWAIVDDLADAQREAEAT